MKQGSVVICAFALRAFSGYCLALPLIGAIAGSGIGTLPRGDRALFEPGGLFLLELLRQQARVLTLEARVAVLFWPFAAAATALASSALYQVMVRPELDRIESARRALTLTPGFVWIGVLETLAAAVVGLCALLAGGAAEKLGAVLHAETGPELATAPVVLGALAAFGWLSILGELGRGELARAGGSPHAALRRGLRHFGPRRAELCAGYLFALGFGVLGVALGARLVEHCDVGRPGTSRVLGVLLIHALVLFWLTLLQAGWTRRVAAALTPAP